MAGSASSIPNPAEPLSPFLLVNLSQCIELQPLTYRSWSTQIEDLLFGYDLFKFVNGSHPCPDSTITNAEKAVVSNPAYTTWIRQDRLIKGALLGTIHSSITPLLLQDKTSNDVWTTLAATYANPSRGHLLQLKDRFKSIVKADLSITDYMRKIKSCTDELAHMGKPIDNEDIIDKVLDGLDSVSYKAIIDAVRARDTLISFEALHEKLIQHELMVKPEPVSTYPSTALTASQRPTTSRNPPRPSSAPGLLPLPSPTTVSSSTNSTPRTTFKGSCQWCHTTGHYLSLCPVFKQLFPTVQVPPRPKFTSTTSAKPQAHTVTTTSPTSSSFILDSRATHHITHDLDTLALHTPYDGTDDIIIGDGSNHWHSSSPGCT